MPKSQLQKLFDHLKEEMINGSIIVQQVHVNEVAEKIGINPRRIWIMLCDLQNSGLINKVNNPGRGTGVTVSLPEKSTNETTTTEKPTKKAPKKKSVRAKARKAKKVSAVPQPKAGKEQTLSESINKTLAEIEELKKVLRKKKHLLTDLTRARRSLKAGGF